MRINWLTILSFVGVLNSIEISKRCQDSYNVEISDEELTRLTNVDSLYKLVHSKIVEDSKRPQG